MEPIMSNFSEYYQDAKKELKKVHWPDKPKVVETTAIVMGCTAVFAIYLWFVDIGISWIFNKLFY